MNKDLRAGEVTEQEWGEFIQYAQQEMTKQIDNINNIKLLIKVNFSDEVQMDKTPMGAMRRNQIRKELLEFANKWLKKIILVNFVYY